MTEFAQQMHNRIGHVVALEPKFKTNAIGHQTLKNKVARPNVLLSQSVGLGSIQDSKSCAEKNN